MNRTLGALAFWLVLIITSLCMTHCANIVPPMGGPRDTLPPLLLRASPADSTLGFNTHKVTFLFDEYVQLDNVNEKLVVSPTLKRPPQVTAKLHSVTMIIKDTLQPNTTYTFNFADAIKDVNERNAVQEFVYVVSTGNYLDSLQLSGHIVNAEVGRVDSNVAVMLYRKLDDDSVVTKEKPVYYTKSRGDGSYRFKNLAPGTYKLFALREENKDLQYDDPAEMIGFPDSTVTIAKSLSDVNLLTFSEVDTSKLPKPADSTLIPEEPKKEKDKDKKKKPRLNMGVNLAEGKQELTDSLHLSFNFPIRSIDTTRMELDEDTTLDPVSFSTTFDSTHTKLSIGYKWRSGLPYRLVVLPGFVVDTNNNSLKKADTVNFVAKRTQDYGEVFVRLTLSDSMRQAHQGDSVQYIVQLVKDKNIKYFGNITKGTWIQHLVTPGDYEIRILLDMNGNNKWDRGRYYGGPKRQPERVVTFPEVQHVKANWLIKPELRL